MLIKMELSFSALAAVSGWPFVVAVLKDWFFPPSSSFPNSLQALTQALQSRDAAQGMFTPGRQAENSCWFPKDGTRARMFSTAAALKVRNYLGCPLLKLYIKHPEDLGYPRTAARAFSPVLSFL